MKLLVDENISYRILKLINCNFPGSEHVTNIKKTRVADTDIWDYAKKNDFIIVTYDEDFYEWQQLRSSPPNIVWLRFGNAPTKRIAKEINNHKREIVEMVTNESKNILEIH